MDDITALQDAEPNVLVADVHLFQPREAVLWKTDRLRERSVTGDKNWVGDSAPDGTAISYWLADDSDDVTVRIEDPVTGETFRTLEGTGEAGLNRVQWNLRGESQGGGGGFGGNQGPDAAPGVYRVVLEVNGRERSTTVRVVEDVWLRAF